MTAAFNLAQLANNLNTSGQLDATDGLNGLVANANLASSGTASSSTYLRGDRTWASITQGKVLQVVFAQRDSNEVYTGSSTPITTNFSATITPSATSSKVLIMGSLNTRGDGGDTNFGAYDLYRNGSVIFTNICGWAANSVNFQLTALNLDSPSSTSALTYTWYIKSAGSGHDVRFNPTPVGALYASSQMILMEIAA